MKRIKRSISIKYFISLLLFGAFVLQGVIFMSFFKQAESNIIQLLKENLQSKVIVLKHVLEKKIEPDNPSSVITFIDNSVATSDIIHAIQLRDESGVLLYNSERQIQHSHHPEQCINIAEIKSANLTQTDCFRFTIRLYNQLDPYYYKGYLFINHDHLNALLSEKRKHYIYCFGAFVIFYFALFGILLKRLLTKPLLELESYAQHHTPSTKHFIIKEFNRIQAALRTTFNRLEQEQENLYKLSTKDPLCGLYNRLSLMDKLKWLLEKKDHPFALLFIDLDNFKHINDTKGHNHGDLLLQKVATAISKHLGSNDFVARFGGDEFVIILPQYEKREKIIALIAQIQEELNQLSDYSMMGASIGISLYPDDGEDASTLLKSADLAMYQAKEMGKNQYCFFTQSLNHSVQEHLHIQELICKGLEENHFQLYYQPKVNIHSGKINQCEALLRLIDPKEGMIPTQKVIEVAEKSGLIVQIGHWVLQETLQQLKAWQNTPLAHISISVNVSTLQLYDKAFITYLRSIIPSEGINQKLDIEITESSLISDLDTTINYLNNIKSLGVTLSLDDFGTGYSSLSYLKQIPFDTLKIDRSFIQDMTHRQQHSFVEMIINIAKTLKLETVAEGVETKEQLRELQKMGCDTYQGFLCAKPLNRSAFEALVQGKCPH